MYKSYHMYVAKKGLALMEKSKFYMDGFKMS